MINNSESHDLTLPLAGLYNKVQMLVSKPLAFPSLNRRLSSRVSQFAFKATLGVGEDSFRKADCKTLVPQLGRPTQFE